MDPINLLVVINLLVSMGANWGGARKGLKTSITKVVERPQSYLQKIQPNISALVLVLTVLGIFNVGTLSAGNIQDLISFRLTGLILFVLFSWFHVWSYRSLGNSYAQDIVIMKNHRLCKTGPYKFIRHPQYLGQILSDLGAGLALMSYIVVPIVLLVELPLFILRAKKEEKMLAIHFKNEFAEYKSKSGFILPFIG